MLRLIILAINVFIGFVWFFEKSLKIPNWLQTSGKLHPLMLHLPIGIIAVFTIFQLFYKGLLNKLLIKEFLKYLALFTAATAFFGFLLGQKDYSENQIQVHKITGILLSFLTFIFYEFYERIQKVKFLDSFGLGAILGLTVWVGHLGGTITHGDDFFGKEEIETPNTVFAKQVHPIFTKTCQPCHNNSKAKGNLNMADMSKLLKGGKKGPIWKANHPESSLFLQRINLPLEHKEHMPPKEKQQLSESEIEILENWVKEGAKIDQAYESLPKNSFFYGKGEKASMKVYDFKDPSSSELDALRTPFLSIEKIATSSPALKVNFFVKQAFKMGELEKLKAIKTQVIRIDLSKMPVDDKVFEVLSQFTNLEHVSLNQTDIKGQGIDKLLKCSKLESISCANTPIDPKNIANFLQQSKPLKIYAWSTALNTENTKNLKHTFDFGYKPDEAEQLKLNNPTLVNQEVYFEKAGTVNFSHTLKGVDIIYALDDEKLDSLKSPKFTKPINFTKNTRIKVKAMKDGWISSEEKEYQFYKSTIVPRKVIENTAVDRAFGNRPDLALIDRKFGQMSNIRDPRWLGFNKHKMDREFILAGARRVEGLSICYASNTYEHTLPPETVEIYLKQQAGDYKLYQKLRPTMPAAYENVRKSIDVKIGMDNVTAVKIIAIPLQTLPKFMKQPANFKPWFFVDEVFFN